MELNREDVKNSGVVFEIRFVDCESSLSNPLFVEATVGNNRIISFDELVSRLHETWDCGDEFVIKQGSKILKSDQDVFSTVYAAAMKDDKGIELSVETSKNEWDFVETASQLSDDDSVGKRSKDVASVKEEKNNKVEKVETSIEEGPKPMEAVEVEKLDAASDEAEETASAKREEDSNLVTDEVQQMSKQNEEAMLMSLEEKPADVNDISEKCEAESILPEMNQAPENAEAIPGMPAQSIFDGSQFPLFDILSEGFSRVSTPSFPLGDWIDEQNDEKQGQERDAYEYCQTWNANNDVGEASERARADDAMNFPSWEDERGKVDPGVENRSIQETLKSLERFLSNDDKPNEIKLRKLLSLLNSVIEEILLRTPDNQTSNAEFREIFGETFDDSFLGTLKQLASNALVVQEIQNALCSESVRNLVVDVARNDVSTIAELRRIVMGHLGDLLSTAGEIFREAPQVLSVLPYLLKWFVSFLEEGKEEPTQEERKPIHSGVLCDGCDDNERKAIALAKGTISGAYICGVRYKSAVRDDFDLCESCEGSGDFEEEYGPFLKIRTPAKAPREIVCVLNPTSFENEPERSESSEASSDVPPGNQSELRCGEGNHPLNSFMVPNRLFACDVCNSTPQRGSVMYGCRLCDWDICRSCALERFPELDVVSAAPVASVSPSVQVPASRTSLRPRATFVADVNFQDGAVLKPGTHFTKIWRVENSSKDLAWPNQCRIVCVGGDLMGAFSSGFLVPPLPPKQVGDVCVQLIAPTRPGRYIGYWRLVTPQNERFGQRFWVDITVEDEGKVPENVSQRVAVVDVDLDKWSAELQQLANMEFLDCERNVALLEEFKGNLEAVINSLLSKD